MNRWEIALITLALLFSCVKQLARITNTISRWLQDVTQITHDVLTISLGKLKVWMFGEAMPPPFALLMSIGLLCVLALSSWADFKILEKSISVIWPWGEGAGVLAGAVVAMVAVLAYLAHTNKAFFARIALLLMLGGLISTQGILAYVRTIEIEKAKIELVASLPTPETQLVIVTGTRQQAQLSDAAMASSSNVPVASDALISRLLPFLTALAAILLSIAEAFGFSRLTSGVGANALAWMSFGPVLALNWVMANFFGLLRQSNLAMHLRDGLLAILDFLQLVSEKLIKLFKAFFDLLEYVRQRLAALLAFLGPAAIHARRARKRDLEVQSDLEDIRRDAAREIERLLAIRAVEKFQGELSGTQANPAGREQDVAMATAALNQFNARISEIRRSTSRPN